MATREWTPREALSTVAAHPEASLTGAGGVNSLGHTLTTGNTNDITQNVGMIGSKTSGTNNFVTKLYQLRPILYYVIIAFA